MARSHDLLSTPYAKSLIKIKARQLCRRADFSSSDTEDLHQQMRHYLLKVAHYFDPDRACLETFVARALDSAVAMILRDRRRVKRRLDLECISLEGSLCAMEEDPTCLWSLLSPDDQTRRTGNAPQDPLEEMEREEAFAHAMSRLHDDDRAIAELVGLYGKAGAARRYGVSRRQVDHALRRMRRHFEAAGLGHD